jgi:hypothetical protein
MMKVISAPTDIALMALILHSIQPVISRLMLHSI